MKKYTFNFDNTDELRAAADAIDTFDKEAALMFKQAMMGRADMTDLGKGKMQITFRSRAPEFGNWDEVDAHKQIKDLADSLLRGSYSRRMELLKTLGIQFT